MKSRFNWKDLSYLLLGSLGIYVVFVSYSLVFIDENPIQEIVFNLITYFILFIIITLSLSNVKSLYINLPRCIFFSILYLVIFSYYVFIPKKIYDETPTAIFFLFEDIVTIVLVMWHLYLPQKTYIIVIEILSCFVFTILYSAIIRTSDAEILDISGVISVLSGVAYGLCYGFSILLWNKWLARRDIRQELNTRDK